MLTVLNPTASLTTPPLETTAPPPPAHKIPPPPPQLKLSATHGKFVMVSAQEHAPAYPALMPPSIALPSFASMDHALNAMTPLTQVPNAQPPPTMIPGTLATLHPVFANSTKKPESPEVASPESSLVPSCSSEPSSALHYTAARKTANLTMPCKRPSSE